MDAMVTTNNGVTSPRMMPNRTWARALTREEVALIPQLEESYVKARTLFERSDIRARGIYPQDSAPIMPDIYAKWLRTATHQYTRSNAESDVRLREELQVQAAQLAGIGNATIAHGEVPLTVAPHCQRAKGLLRGFVADGDRIHMHHTPAYESVAADILHHEAISVGIGDEVHKRLHHARDWRRDFETRPQQVEGDFDFIKPHMEARGYTAREIARAREKAHDLNNDLGLYRGGK